MIIIINKENQPKGHLLKPIKVTIGSNFIITNDPKNSTWYLPFNYYFTDKRASESIHRIFANLDYNNQEDIINFCTNYGLLGKYAEDFDVEEYFKESVEYFKRECRMFKFVLSLFESVTLKDVNLLKKAYEEYNFTPSITLSDDGNIIEPSNDELLQGAAELVLWNINERFENTLHPFINMVKNTNVAYDYEIPKMFSWRCDSLISAMYLMMYLDYQSPFMNKTCEFCGKFYLSTRSNAEYCSKKCQEAEKQRRHRRKNKCFKLLQEGKSKEFILQKLYDVDESQINEWIYEYGEKEK